MAEVENKEVIPSGPRGFKFWKETLKGARMVVAPMVDASELAWRMMSRRYGAELCYTPMLHASVFVKDARYRRENLVTCPEDRPLIVQFCANDPETFLKACQLAAPCCDAIDLNLGCPQSIAKKGHYGSFLMEEWTLIEDMIKKVVSEVDIPITAKIRIFPDVGETVEYAKMLERAGVSLLTVHGRTRNQKGALTGIADWSYIKKVKESVKIPVFANGNIQYLPDLERCLEETGVEGVMSAEGNLHNPAIFRGQSPLVWDAALEYMELVQQYPCPLSFVRGHVFKIMYHCFNMPENFDIRYQMSKASSVDIMIEVTKELKSKMMDYVEKRKEWVPPEDSPLAKLPLPPWMCQPYVRIPAEEHMKRIAESQRKAQERDELEIKNGFKRENSDGTKIISNKKLKRMKRNPYKNFDKPPFDFDKCPCSNPRGIRCLFLLCRGCCKSKCHAEELVCKGHKSVSKKKREQLMMISLNASKGQSDNHDSLDSAASPPCLTNSEDSAEPKKEEIQTETFKLIKNSVSYVSDNGSPTTLDEYSENVCLER